MSLINNMLNDLEKKRKETTVPKNDVNPLKAVKKDKSKHPPLFFLIFLLIVIILYGAWFFFSNSIKKIDNQVSEFTNYEQEEIIQLNGLMAKKELSKEALVDPLQNEALLKSITVTHKENQTSLKLNLTHPIHYQTHVSPDHKIVTLKLANIDLEKPLPSIENVIIKNAHLNKVNNDLILILEVIPNTEIENMIMSETEPYELNLTLKNLEIESMPIEELMEKEEVPLSPLQISENLYKNALSLMEKGNIKDAKTELENSIKTSPNFIPARKTLVTILIRQKQYQNAILVIQKGLKQTPDSIELIKLHSQILVMQNRINAALIVLKRLVPDLNEDPEYYALMATLEQRLGRHEIAIELYKQLLNYNSNNGIWWMGLGISLESVGKLNTALNAYKHAVESGDLSPSIKAYVETKISTLEH